MTCGETIVAFRDYDNDVYGCAIIASAVGVFADCRYVIQ